MWILIKAKLIWGLFPYMQGLRPVYCPSVPFISNFPELNLRTYVYDRSGRSGVWFFSLDAASWLSVKIARCFFALNYQHAKMRHEKSSDGWISLQAQRRGQASQKFVYQPKGIAQPAVFGSLSTFWSSVTIYLCRINAVSCTLGRFSTNPISCRQSIWMPTLCNFLI